MTWTKFKVKFLDNVVKGGFALTDLLCQAVPGLHVVDSHPTNGGYIVAVSSVEDLEKLETPESKATLRGLQLEILPLQSYLAEKTVFIPKVNQDVSQCPPPRLIQLINNANDNKLKATSASVFKPTNKYTDRQHLKISFLQVDMAKYALNNGLFIGSQFIEPGHIFPEEYVEIPQCFRCFSYAHTVSSCEADKPFCSKCAGRHSFKQCNSEYIKCVNCSGNHRSLANTCSVRKAKLAELKALKRSPQPPSNSNPNGQNLAHQKSSSPPPPPPSGNAWSGSVNSATVNGPATPLASVNPTPSSSTAFPSMPSAKFTSHSPSVLTSNRPTTSSNPTILPPPPPTTPLPQQPQPNPSSNPPQSLPHQFNTNLWKMHFEIWKEAAKIHAAGDNPEKYLNGVNSFFSHYNLPTVPIPDNLKLSSINSSTQSSPPKSHVIPTQYPSPKHPNPLSPPPISPTTQAQALPQLILSPTPQSNPPLSPLSSSTPNYGIDPPTPLILSPTQSPAHESQKVNFNLNILTQSQSQSQPHQVNNSDLSNSESDNESSLSDSHSLHSRHSHSQYNSSSNAGRSASFSDSGSEVEVEVEEGNTSTLPPLRSTPHPRAPLTRARSASLDSLPTSSSPPHSSNARGAVPKKLKSRSKK